MSRIGKFSMAILGLLVAVFTVSSAFAAPAPIDPNYELPDNYWQGGGNDNIAPNRNQLMVRLTGREYSERVDNNILHYEGSGMRFVEDLVNDRIINASVTIGGNTIDKVFHNYVDLIIKRLLDANQWTPLDYDTQTFAYVDMYNPATNPVPNAANSTVTDTNGDGNFSSYEQQEIIRATCLNLPLIGDTCLNMFLVSLGDFLGAGNTFGLYPTTTPTWYGGAGNPVVNNPGNRFIDFESYSVANPTDTTHMFLASYPNRTFDNEIEDCIEPKDPLIDAGTCDESLYRDDDDGLFLEIQLKNLAIDILLQPPVTTSVTTNVDDAGDFALNITDIEDAANMDNYANVTDGTPASNLVAIAGATVPGCPQYAVGDPYDAACDLSNYVKAYGRAFIPDFKVQLSVRIVSDYNDYQDGVTSDTINLGVQVQFVQLDLNLALVLNAGPFCLNDDPDNDPTRAAGWGQDGLGVYYDYSDNPNNCRTPADNDGVPNASDDSTYSRSQHIVNILPYARAELQAYMEDLFSPTDNPGYFFGPTRLLDLNGTIDGISFDIPWEYNNGNTDYAKLQLSLDSSVDSDGAINNQSSYITQGLPANFVGDTVNEFWADWVGIAMPFNAGVGLEWFTDSSFTTEVESCVKNEGAFTGYVDGYASTATGAYEDADNPSVSRPIPRLKTRFTGADINGGAWNNGSSADYDADLLGLQIPDVNGQAPYSGPKLDQNGAPMVTAAVTSPTGSYALGLGLHQNLLSKLLYEAVIDGLLCIDIDPRDPNNDIGNSLSGLLTTDLWGFFIPFLADNYEGADMAIRIIPTIQNPDQIYDPDGTIYAAGTQSYASELSEFVNNFASAVSQENPIPRIITGGLNIYNPLKDRYAGAITTGSELFIDNTIVPGSDPLATQRSYGLWPDLSIVIPHLVIEWFVWDDSNPSIPLKRRAFAMDLGLNVALNIDILQDPGVAGGASPLDPVTSNVNFQRPAYSGTDFPIGCGPTVATPCEIVDVPSRLVLFLGGLLDLEVNAILVYDEMSDAITDQVNAGTVAESFLNNGATDYTLYENAISNLLGMVLSSEISFLTEIGFDPAAWLNIPVVLTVPYIGPSFVANDGAAGVPVEPAEQLACGPTGDAACTDPLLAAGNPTGWRDVSDNDLNGFGDYLVVAAGVDLNYLNSDYLFRLVDSFLEPALNSACSSASVTCQTELYETSLNTLIGGAPQMDAFEDAGLPRGYVSPKTYIKGVEKAHATETIISFEGSHPNGDALKYAWRVDGGLWTPYLDWNRVRIPGLLEGNHVFEVKAKDTAGNVEWRPATIEFVVDSVAPKVEIAGDRVQGSDVQFVANVRDAQTDADNVRVSYRVNGGEWSRYSYSKDISLDLADGRHTIEVRAIDDAENVSVPTSLNFNVQDSGFGCSTSGNGSADFLLVLLVPAVLFWRRRQAFVA